MKRALVLLAIMHCSTASAILVNLPDSKIITERLSARGFEHFQNYSEIADSLGGKQMEVLGISIVLDLAIHDYIKTMEKSGGSIRIIKGMDLILHQRRHKLFEAIFLDYPEAIKELESMNLLAPVPRSKL